MPRCHQQIGYSCFIFIISIFFVSFLQNVKGDVVLKENDVLRLNITDSVKLLFMNNSFQHIEAPISILPWPLPSQLPPGLNGTIAIISNSLNTLLLSDENGKTIIVDLVTKGECLGIVFWQNDLQQSPQCCRTTISDEMNVPTTLIGKDAADKLFSILNISIASSTPNGVVDKAFTLWMNQSQLSSVEIWYNSELVIEYQIVLTSVLVSVILFILYRFYLWLQFTQWNISKIPRFFLLTVVIELIVNLLKIATALLFGHPVPFIIMLSIQSVYVPVQVLTLMLMALFWFESLNSVIQGEKYTILQRIKYPVAAFNIVFLLIMEIGAFESETMLQIAYLTIDMIAVMLTVFYAISAVRIRRYLRDKSTQLNEGPVKRVERMTWNVVGVVLSAFFAIIATGCAPSLSR